VLHPSREDAAKELLKELDDLGRITNALTSDLHLLWDLPVGPFGDSGDEASFYVRRRLAQETFLKYADQVIGEYDAAS